MDQDKKNCAYPKNITVSLKKKANTDCAVHAVLESQLTGIFAKISTFPELNVGLNTTERLRRPKNWATGRRPKLSILTVLVEWTRHGG